MPDNFEIQLSAFAKRAMRILSHCASEEAAGLIEATSQHPMGNRSRVLVTRDNLVLSEQR